MNLQDIKNVTADDKGMILLSLNGLVRRFIKEKLISYLLRNPQATGFEIPRMKTTHPKKEKKLAHKSKTPKEVIKKRKRGEWHRKPVIAILPDGTIQEFGSGKEASLTLGVYKSGVCRVLNGKLPHVNQIVFKFKTAS